MTPTSSHVPSAASIVLPPRESALHWQASNVGQQSLTPAELSAFFDDLREMRFSCGPAANMNDLVENLIVMCIEVGIDTAGQIIGVAKKEGYGSGHVGALLGAGIQAIPRRWHRNEGGRYSLP